MPVGLRGPVDVALARAADVVPSTLAGDTPVFDLKFDGFRIAIVRTLSGARLWSRQGRDLSAAFPDLRTAAEFYLKPGCVCDGEAVILHEGKLSFDLLQSRMGRRHGPAIYAAARDHPASYVAFDLLAVDGDDLRRQPYRMRRSRLEQMARTWAPPMQISPITRDYTEALAMFEDYRPVGIEGLVVKANNGRYRPGAHDWVKVKSRHTREIICAAVTGPITRPTALIAGLYADDGRLVIAGRSTELSPAQSRQLAAALTPAGPDHPWPDVIGAGVFGSRRTIAIIRTEPVVVEVSAGVALQAGRFRHPIRMVRVRPDLLPSDVEPLQLS